MQEQPGALGALRRRWYLIPIGIMVTLLLCLLAGHVVAARYVVAARVLLVPATPASDPLANPYLSLGGLEPATSVLARTISSGDAARDLQSSGSTGTYAVGQDPLTAGPVLLVTIEDSTSAAALKTLDVVLKQLPRTLQQLQVQVGVPATSMIKSSIISQDSQPQIARKSQVRAVLVAGAAGAAGTALAAALLDGLLLRRRDALDPVEGQDPIRSDDADEPEPLSWGRRARWARGAAQPPEEDDVAL